MANTIRAGIALDGEREFKQAVAGINSELKNLQTETKLVQETFKGEANSLRALEERHKVLNKTLEQNKKKEEEIAKALQHATQTRDKVKTGLDKLISGYEEEKKKLDEMRKSGKASETEMQSQEKTVKRYADAVKVGEKNLATAENRIKNWTKQQTNAKLQTAQTNNALKENTKYLKEAGNSASKTAKSIDEYGKKQKEAGKETENAGDAMQALATAMVSSGVKEKVEEITEALYQCAEAAGEFKTGVAKVMTIADKNVMTTEKMSEEILKMSGKTGQSVKDLSESAYQAISASVKTADAVGFVGDATKLAVGGFTDQTTAVDTLTTVINAYRKETSDAAHISDVLVETQNKGKTTVGEMAAALGQVIPSASSAGVSFENLSTAMALVTKNGVRTDIASTSLRAMFSELSKSGSNVAKTLKKETGKSFSELMNSGMSLGDVLDILWNLCGKNKDAFSGLFGNTRSMSAAFFLAQEGAANFNSELEVMTSTSGQAQKAFEEMANTPEYVSKRFETSIENMKIAIGSELEPAITGLKKKGTDAFLWATDFVKDNPGVVAAVTGLTTALGLLAGGITTLAAATAIIKVLKGALIGLGAVTSVGIPIIGATAAVAGLATAVGILSSKNKEAERADKELGQSIEETTNQIKANIEERNNSSMEESERATRILEDKKIAEENLARAKERVKDAQEAVNKAEINGNASYNYRNSDEQVKRLEEAKKACQEAEEQYSYLNTELENVTSQSDETEESITSVTDATLAYARAMDEEVSSVNEEAANSFAELTKSVENAIDGFNEFNSGEEVSAEKILKNLESQKDGLEKWTQNMKSIAKRGGEGMTEELYSYLQQMGPSMANYIDAIANMTGPEFERFCKEMNEKLGIGMDSWTDTATKKTEEAKKSTKSIDDATKSEAGKNAEGNKEQGGEAYGAIAESGKEAVSETEKVTKEIDDATRSHASQNRDHNLKEANEATDVSEAIEKNKAKNKKAVNDSLNVDAKQSKGKFQKVGAELGDETAKGLKSKKIAVSNASKFLVSGGPGIIRSKRNVFRSAGSYIALGVASGMQSQIPSITSAADKIVSQAERVMKAKAEIKSPARRFRNKIGKYIGRGVAVGITESGKEVNLASVRLINDSMTAAMKEAEINSPSKKWRKKVGQQMGKGLALGISDSGKNAKKSGTTLAKQVQEAATKWLKAEGKKNAKASSAEYQAYFYERLQKDAKKKGGSYYKAIKKYVEKQEKELADAQVKALKSKISKIGTYDNKAINDQIASWEKQIKIAKKYGKAYQKEFEKQAQEEIKQLKELQSQRKEYAVSSGAIDAWKTYFNISEKAELDYWDKIRKIKSLSAAQQLQADKAYNEASKQYEESRKEAYEEYAEKIKDINDDLKSNIENLESSYADAVKATTDTIMGSYDLFDTFLSESVSGKELLENMRMQAWGYGEWEKDLDTLRKKFSEMNLSNDLLTEIVEKGPKAAAQIKALLDLDPDELLQYSKLYEQKAEIAKKEAIKQNEELRADTDKQIEELKKKADEELKNVLDEYNKTIAAIEAPLADGLSAIANNAASWGEATIIAYAQAMAKKAADPSTWTEVTKNIQSNLSSSGPAGTTTTQTASVTTSSSTGTKTASNTVKYFKEYTGNLTNWEEVIKKRYDGKLSKSQIEKIAKLNGIANYTGSKKQKEELLKLLKKGKLKKPNKNGGIIDRILPFLAADGDDGIVSAQLGEMILPKKFTADIVPRFTNSVERLMELIDKIPNTNSLNGLVGRGSEKIYVINNTPTVDTDALEKIMYLLEYLPKLANMKMVLSTGTLVGELADPIGEQIMQNTRRRNSR